jgi:hypothetical protein
LEERVDAAEKNDALTGLAGYGDFMFICRT